MSNQIREAVEAAARQFCVCDGECFETRHGMMHGPCEQDFTAARRTIAAFLRALPVGLRGVPGAILDGHAPAIMPHRLAAAVASAAAEETPDE